MTALATTPVTLPRRPALAAGLGLLVMAVVAGLANFLAIEPLLTAGDADAIAEAVAGSESQLLWGTAGLAVAAALDVVVALALWKFFAPIAPRTAATGGVLRLVYTAVFVAAIVQLPAAVGATSDADIVAALERFETIWDLGLIIFGAHLVVTGVLAWMVGGAGPRVVGALVAIAGAGYAIDGIGAAFIDGYSLDLVLYTFVGELVLMVWLLVRAFARPAAA